MYFYNVLLNAYLINNNNNNVMTRDVISESDYGFLFSDLGDAIFAVVRVY